MVSATALHVCLSYWYCSVLWDGCLMEYGVIQNPKLLFVAELHLQYVCAAPVSCMWFGVSIAVIVAGKPCVYSYSLNHPRKHVALGE